MKRLNLVGKKFGKWTVIKYIDNKNWLCRCSCGLEKNVNGSNLRGGISSGCRHCNTGAINRLPVGEANFNDKLSNCKAGAKQRGLVWELTKEEAKELFQGNCFYCGIEPLQVWHHTETNGLFLNNGIDRKDSGKGYIKDNCVPCCKKCNYMKRTLSVDDFLNHIQRIVEHLKIEAL